MSLSFFSCFLDSILTMIAVGKTSNDGGDNLTSKSFKFSALTSTLIVLTNVSHIIPIRMIVTNEKKGIKMAKSIAIASDKLVILNIVIPIEAFTSSGHAFLMNSLVFFIECPQK